VSQPHAGQRSLIINADDFGRSPGINEGIVEAHLRGIVTSASLMVRWPDAVGAADFARHNPRFGLGLHVDLGEWYFERDAWKPRYQVVDLDDTATMRAELERQIEAFRNLTGAEPSHIDSHQHVHMRRLARPIFLDVSRILGIPLRRLNSPAIYRGDFFGQTPDGAPLRDAIERDALLDLIVNLPPGLSEIVCHPATRHDTDSTYGPERLRELHALCDPAIRLAVESSHINLCSHHLPVPS